MNKQIGNFRLRASFIFIFALVCLGFFGRETFAQSGGCDCVPNEVIFELVDSSNLPAVAAQYALNPAPLGQVGTPVTYRMQITNGQTPLQTVAAMRADARITKPEVNRKLSAVERQGLDWTLGQSWAIGGSAKGFNRQWVSYKIRLNEAFVQGKTRGAGVTVAVLDTGIDLTHPAFAGKLVAGYDFVNNDNNPNEEGVLRQGAYGHGTHVAGIIALTAPDAKIMPIRVLDAHGEGELWRVTQAVIWAAQNGADVVNISFGYPQKVNLIKDLIDCADTGATPTGKTFPEIGLNRLAIVAAAGNGGNSSPIYPAAEDLNGMLAVGASTRYDLLAKFSTYDRAWVEVTAPGENIVSALPGGRYGVWSGTSMSAPIVSGIAALVKSKYPNLTVPHDLLDQVKETSVDIRFNNGNVRLRRVDALCAVTNNLACPIPPTAANQTASPEKIQPK